MQSSQSPLKSVIKCPHELSDIALCYYYYYYYYYYCFIIIIIMVVINIIIIITFICQTQIMNENDTPNPIIC